MKTDIINGLTFLFRSTACVNRKTTGKIKIIRVEKLIVQNKSIGPHVLLQISNEKLSYKSISREIIQIMQQGSPLKQLLIDRHISSSDRSTDKAHTSIDR